LIRHSPPEQPTLQEAQAEPQRFRHTRVRWGGVIVAVDNLSQSTLVEILAKPLESDGRPYGDQGDGRFIARFPGFIDPMRYPKDRSLTVTGTLSAGMNRSIGEFSYHYPIVDVVAHHLWPKPVSHPPSPYLWDPYPWRPFHHYPYPHPYWW
jgi:outer membrane lipoprotein